jgi:hypothetical protein
MVLRLTGWSALAALRRRVSTPLRAVRDASVGRFADDGWQLVGTGVPFTEIRFGSFRRRGRRRFLAFTRREPVLIVRCDRSRGAPYDVVAVQLGDPDSVQSRLEEALRAVR